MSVEGSRSLLQIKGLTFLNRQLSLMFFSYMFLK